MDMYHLPSVATCHPLQAFDVPGAVGAPEGGASVTVLGGGNCVPGSLISPTQYAIPAARFVHAWLSEGL